MQRHFHTPLPTLRQIFARAHLRLVLFAVLLCSATLVLTGFVVVQSYAERNLGLSARTIAYTVEPAMVFGDEEAIVETVGSVVSNSDVGRITITAPDGRPLHEWERPESGLVSLIGNALQGVLAPPPATRPVLYDNEVIGSVTVHANMASLASYLLAGIVISGCCIGITLIATRIFSRHLREDVLDPLDQLVEVAHAARQDRDFARRVPRAGIAEVDRFARDFNALLDELQGWQASVLDEKAQLEHRASHDALTQLGNAALFQDRIAAMIARAAQQGASFGVLFIDLDDFKGINDGYGHQVGDAVLVTTGQRLAQAIRDKDSVYRLGGDEFSVILGPDIDLQQARAVASRIAERLADPIHIGSATVDIGASVGMALYPDDGTTPDTLLSRADTEMYRIKKTRKVQG